MCTNLSIKRTKYVAEILLTILLKIPKKIYHIAFLCQLLICCTFLLHLFKKRLLYFILIIISFINPKNIFLFKSYSPLTTTSYLLKYAFPTNAAITYKTTHLIIPSFKTISLIHVSLLCDNIP